MSKIDIIVERLKVAPPDVVEAVLALIERLESAKSEARPQPASIMRHLGVLKDSKVFAGDPVVIQEAMRREWD